MFEPIKRKPLPSEIEEIEKAKNAKPLPIKALQLPMWKYALLKKQEKDIKESTGISLNSEKFYESPGALLEFKINRR